MNEQRLMEIKVRADHATDGPWEHTQLNLSSVKPPLNLVHAYDKLGHPGEYEIRNEHDAEFIAHARKDVPELLNKVWEQNTELKMLRISRAMWKQLDAKRAAENAELQSKLDRVELAEAKARFENERLREALEEIAEHNLFIVPQTAVKQMAKNALAGTPHE